MSRLILVMVITMVHFQKKDLRDMSHILEKNNNQQDTCIMKLCSYSCADPESFARGVQFFFLDEGREDPNTTKSGSSSDAGLVAL